MLYDILLPSITSQVFQLSVPAIPVVNNPGKFNFDNPTTGNSTASMKFYTSGKNGISFIRFESIKRQALEV